MEAVLLETRLRATFTRRSRCCGLDRHPPEGLSAGESRMVRWPMSGALAVHGKRLALWFLVLAVLAIGGIAAR